MKLAVHSQLGRAAETFSALVALVGRSTRVDHHVLQKFALIRKPPVTLVALKAEAGFVRELEFSEPLNSIPGASARQHSERCPAIENSNLVRDYMCISFCQHGCHSLLLFVYRGCGCKNVHIAFLRNRIAQPPSEGDTANRGELGKGTSGLRLISLPR